jgi:hypothetical protein
MALRHEHCHPTVQSLFSFALYVRPVVRAPPRTLLGEVRSLHEIALRRGFCRWRRLNAIAGARIARVDLRTSCGVIARLAPLNRSRPWKLIGRGWS